MRNAFIVVTVGIIAIGSCFIHDLAWVAFIGVALALSGTAHCISWLVFSDPAWYENEAGEQYVSSSWLAHTRLETLNVLCTGAVVLYIFITNV